MSLTADNKVCKNFHPECLASDRTPGFIRKECQHNTDNRHQCRTTSSQIDNARGRGPLLGVRWRLTAFQSDLGIVVLDKNPPGSSQPDKSHGEEGEEQHPCDSNTYVKNHSILPWSCRNRAINKFVLSCTRGCWAKQLNFVKKPRQTGWRGQEIRQKPNQICTET